MNCLSPEQMMELVYREADPEKLLQYKNHIKQCHSCMDDFMELSESRHILSPLRAETSSPVIILKQPEKRTLLSRYGSIAAALLFALAAGYFTSSAINIGNQQRLIAEKQASIEAELQKASVITEEYSKQNYMLIMGLKDYVDNTISERRVAYETF